MIKEKWTKIDNSQQEMQCPINIKSSSNQQCAINFIKNKTIK